MIYLELFITFFKIGLFTFGGGYAMLPLIEQEVLSHGWLTAEEIVNFIAVSESTPGPFAINISTYVGVETAGIPGAFTATPRGCPSFLRRDTHRRADIRFLQEEPDSQRLYVGAEACGRRAHRRGADLGRLGGVLSGWCVRERVYKPGVLHFSRHFRGLGADGCEEAASDNHNRLLGGCRYNYRLCRSGADLTPRLKGALCTEF